MNTLKERQKDIQTAAEMLGKPVYADEVTKSLLRAVNFNIQVRSWSALKRQSE